MATITTVNSNVNTNNYDNNNHRNNSNRALGLDDIMMTNSQANMLLNSIMATTGAGGLGHLPPFTSFSAPTATSSLGMPSVAAQLQQQQLPTLQLPSLQIPSLPPPSVAAAQQQQRPTVLGFGCETMVPEDDICRISFYVKCMLLGCGLGGLFSTGQELLSTLSDYAHATELPYECQVLLHGIAFGDLALEKLMNRVIFVDHDDEDEDNNDNCDDKSKAKKRKVLPPHTSNIFFQPQTPQDMLWLLQEFPSLRNNDNPLFQLTGRVMICSSAWLKHFYIMPCNRYYARGLSVMMMEQQHQQHSSVLRRTARSGRTNDYHYQEHQVPCSSSRKRDHGEESEDDDGLQEGTKRIRIRGESLLHQNHHAATSGGDESSSKPPPTTKEEECQEFIPMAIAIPIPSLVEPSEPPTAVAAAATSIPPLHQHHPDFLPSLSLPSLRTAASLMGPSPSSLFPW